jgi:hypothetical protein
VRDEAISAGARLDEQVSGDGLRAQPLDGQGRQLEGRRDGRLLARIREVPEANYEAYGYRRLWKQLLREASPSHAAKSSG